MLWSPILQNDSRTAAENASAFLPDTRARHYWDLWSFASRAYTQQFQFPKNRVAWEIFVVYKPGIVWKGKPPEPTLWLQALDLDIGTKYTPRLLEIELEKWIR